MKKTSKIIVLSRQSNFSLEERLLFICQNCGRKSSILNDLFPYKIKVYLLKNKDKNETLIHHLENDGICTQCAVEIFNEW